MIIKKLQMCNIRSYTIHHPIVFSPGTILFQGDVGSGKSTILLAIEFALFGLGDIEGQHLLRGKENEGWVRLELVVNGKDYTVYRSLVRKRKYVRQGEGYIIEGHVPSDVIEALLEEQPDVAGLAVPGMPQGSPGMSGDLEGPLEILAFDQDSEVWVYTNWE